ncbi:MAG: molybdenum ABC transporter ATP-binding protein [Hyphomicrobiaceae bacterium]
MIEVDLQFTRPGFALSVQFSADAGLTAIFGPSGAGKSTILAMIAGQVHPDRGRIIVGGETLFDSDRGIDVPSHRRRAGLIHQTARLFPHMTVRQNLEFGRRFAAGRASPIPFAPLVEALGIAALLDRRPAGLSGGERQRIAIGRSILSAPRMLLMDEPLAALDHERRQEIMPLIEQLRDELALPILYVSHQIEEVARLADRVAVIETGRLVSMGPPVEALDRTDLGGRAGGAGRAAVIEATIAAYDATYRLTELWHPAGPLFTADQLGNIGRQVRLVVRASDVAIALERPHQLSIRNVLEGTVATIETTDAATSLIEIALRGGGRLAASLTRKAADELDLRPGAHVYALVKTMALDRHAQGAQGATPDRA